MITLYDTWLQHVFTHVVYSSKDLKNVSSVTHSIIKKSLPKVRNYKLLHENIQIIKINTYITFLRYKVLKQFLKNTETIQDGIWDKKLLIQIKTICLGFIRNYTDQAICCSEVCWALPVNLGGLEIINLIEGMKYTY